MKQTRLEFWTHHDLMRDLADSLHIASGVPGGSVPRWVTIHASLGSVWLERGCPQADVLTVRGSHTKQEVAIYEVKASRSDWTTEMREEKWQNYLPFCHRLLFAVPSGMVRQHEVPEGCGLITRNDNGWSVGIAGARRTCVWEQPAYSLAVALLLSMTNRGDGTGGSVRRRQDLDWALGARDHKRAGRVVGRKVADRLRLGDAALDALVRSGVCPHQVPGGCGPGCELFAPHTEERSSDGHFDDNWRRRIRLRECWEEKLLR